MLDLQGRLSILTQPTREREQSSSGQSREVSHGFSTDLIS